MTEIQENKSGLPEGWIEAKLWDYVKIGRWSSPRPIHNYISDSWIPWVKIADATASNTRYINKTNQYILESWRSTTVFPWDLIVSNSATPWIPKIMWIEACVHDGWLTFNEYKNIDKNFLYYFFLDFRKRLNHSASWSVFKNLKTDIVRSVEFNLPPLSTQKLIAKILSSFDDKIELLREQNETLEKIWQEIFKEWFGKYKVWDELPEGWRVYNFKELVKHIKPWTNYQPKRVENWIPFVNWRNVKNGFLDLSDVKYITTEEYERVHKSWIPEENDILITRIWTLWNVWVINKDELPLAVHYNNINIKSDVMTYQFIYFLLKSEYFLYFYHMRKKQAVQEYITIEDVESIPVILPEDLSLINKKENVLITLFDKIRWNYKQIQTLSKTRDILLSKLMKGEVLVKDL